MKRKESEKIEQKESKYQSCDENDENDDDVDINESDSSEENNDENDEEDEISDLSRRLYYFSLSKLETNMEEDRNIALKALLKARDVLLESNDEIKKIHKKSKSKSFDEKKVPPGSSLVIRSISDDRCLMCMISLVIYKIYQHQDLSHEILGKELKYALIWFPRFIQANYLYARYIKQYVTQADIYNQVEVYLIKAVAVGRILEKEKEKDMETRSHSMRDEDVEIETEELRYLKLAEEELCLVLCQNGKFEQVIPHLKSLHYSWRLSKDILSYDLGAIQSSNEVDIHNIGQPEYLTAIDQFLPSSMIDHLNQVFRPESPYWLEHDYDVVLNSSKKVGYFSYIYPLKERSAVSSIEQIIDWIYKRSLHFFPTLSTCRYAEWWTHSRPHCSGHQLHFDSDETAIESGFPPNHPLVTLIIFISGDIGGPTLVTDQVLGSNLATKGWLCYPTSNRAVIFNAKYLHGVIPGRGPTKNPEGRRLSFMVGFWKDIKASYRGIDKPGDCKHEINRPLYSLLESSVESRSRYSWHKEMTKVKFSDEKIVVDTTVQVMNTIQIAPIWEPIEEVQEPTKKKQSASAMNYNSFFQGF